MPTNEIRNQRFKSLFFIMVSEPQEAGSFIMIKSGLMMAMNVKRCNIPSFLIIRILIKDLGKYD